MGHLFQGNKHVSLGCSPERKSKGQALVELLVALGISAVILPALLTGLVSSREGRTQQKLRLEAVSKVKEGEEALRVVREKGLSSIKTT